MVQGTMYTVALWFSGGNILVPIVLHALYQFFSSFFVWALASGDLRARIFLEEQVLTHRYPIYHPVLDDAS